MPELPEVETVCKGLVENILNLEIKNIKVLNYKLRYFIPTILEKKIVRTKIKSIIRRGKNGFLILNNNYIINFHLGMTGKFSIKSSKYNKQKHDHLLIELNNNKNLVYNDVRKFGYILLEKKPFDIFKFNKMGVEPSLVLYFKKELFLKIVKKSTSIKSILLDQSFICGIGNIYASEILFHSNISPFKKGDCFSKRDFFKLIFSIKYILTLAIKKGGSSIKNYENINSDLGYFQTKFKVYDRKGLPCYNCKNLIIKTTQQGRSTYYCKKCQS